MLRNRWIARYYEKYDRNYKSKRGKTYNFSKYLLPIAFLRDIHGGHLSIEKADNKQSNFANELNNFDKGIKKIEKKIFFNNLGLLFSAREKGLTSCKSRLFAIKNLDKIPIHETTPEKATKAKTKRKVSSLKLCEEFLNKIKNDEKNINKQIFNESFNYQNPSFLVKIYMKTMKIKMIKL